MNRTAPDAPATTTVSGLSDRHLVQRLKELTAVEHQLEVVVIDHLRELERRRLYLSWGFSSLFDYAMRELGYSEAAAWRRIKAMRLCGEVEGARERMRDGSLTLNAAALLQHAFDRQERKRSGGGLPRGRSAVAPTEAPGAGAPTGAPSAPAQAGERAEEPNAGPVLDSSARQALVEEAAGKSTRQVENLLAGVDPELTMPVDRIRPHGAGRWEIKAVIGDECRRGLEQLRGLLSHVDPHMTLGQLLGRVVREAVERHDPARPPRGRRTGRRARAGATDKTSAPKDASGPNAASRRHTTPAGVACELRSKDAPRTNAVGPAQRPAVPSGVTAAAKAHADSKRPRSEAANRPRVAVRPSVPKESAGPNFATASARPAAVPTGAKTSAAKAHADSKRPCVVANRPRVAVQPSAAKESAGPDSVAASARPAAMPTGAATSPAKAPADSMRGRAAPAKRPAGGGCTGTSAPTAGGGRQRHAAPPHTRSTSRGAPPTTSCSNALTGC